VPLTLTAVHGVGAQDSGIGSGVLNAMQQIGGALGLAILSTVAVGAANDKAASIAGGLAQLGQSAGLPADPQQAQALIGHVAFTEGSVQAFLVGSLMILTATALVLTFLRVKHTEMATDGAEPAVHGRRTADPALVLPRRPLTRRLCRRERGFVSSVAKHVDR